MRDELAVMARANEKTREIWHFLFHGKFPVNPRHNAKIYREKLTRWASGKHLI